MLLEQPRRRHRRRDVPEAGAVVGIGRVLEQPWEVEVGRERGRGEPDPREAPPGGGGREAAVAEDCGQHHEPEQHPIHEAERRRPAASQTRREAPPRREVRVERRETQPQEGEGQEAGELHRPEPVVDLDGGEEDEVEEQPDAGRRAAGAQRAPQQEEQREREGRHDGDAEEALHPVVPAGQDHAGGDQDPGEQQPVLVVRGRQLRPRDVAVPDLVDQRDELPIVPDRDVHRVAVHGREQERQRSEREQVQQRQPGTAEAPAGGGRPSGNPERTGDLRASRPCRRAVPS